MKGNPRHADWGVIMAVENLYQKFCTEEFDERGVLNRFSVQCPSRFNFSYDVVDEIARQEPDRRAMVWCNPEGEERIFTFGDMKRFSDKTASMLAARGITKGDKVMLILKRHYEFWFSILALHKLGAVVCPATHLLTQKDLVYRFEAGDIKAVICSLEGEISDCVLEAAKQCPEVRLLYGVRGKKEGFLDFDSEMEVASGEVTRPEQSCYDDMLMFFTSGTTGYPKMVMHDFSYPLAHIITARHWQNCRPDGLHLTVSDTGWGKAVWGKLYGQWLMAAGIFVYDFDQFSPNSLLAMIEKYRITTFCAPPTIYRFFVKEGMKGYDISSLEYATTAGEPLNPEVYHRFLELTGLRLMEGFGQTETTLIAANLVGMENKPGSFGRNSPLYDMDVVDGDDNSAPAGVPGEIVLRLKQDQHQFGLFSNYYKDADLSERVCRNGIYHTGDVACKDEDGYIWYVSRIDDVIKSSGYRIGPFEVESVLMEHPAVLECAVTGVPHPMRGQEVKATIVLTKGYSPSGELKKELQDYVKEATAPYKYPRIIDFVEELPKTISGKIRRVELR
ncbi:MAG: AMP-dependent synthetase and ligase [Oscillospiraceae bacterium]|nr:AMP-dependent synthetase and ligase [Oscillospiraceae bacterium]